MESIDLRKKDEYYVYVGSLKYPVYFMHLRYWDYGILEQEGQEPKIIKKLNPFGGLTVAYVRFIDSFDMRKEVLDDFRVQEAGGSLLLDDRLNIIGAYGTAFCRLDEQYDKSEGRKYSMERLKMVLALRQIYF